jgi:sugar phosphate isomerase/epimerase
MKLAVSNIAWTNEEEPQVAELLKRMGVSYIEVAPSKIWPSPRGVDAREVDAYTSFWHKYGIEIVAVQSVLFNRPDLKIFESKSNCDETLSYLKEYIKLVGKLGAKVIVFGSPKNRQRKSLGKDEADLIAIPFFKSLGKESAMRGIKFCIEPNARDYSCDYITTARQGIELVESVDNEGFCLHLDIACMSLAGDNIKHSIRAASTLLEHFHISSPMLGQVEALKGVDHVAAAAALREIDYKNYISIEMRPSEVGSNVARVERAVRFVKATYSV